MNKKTIFLSTAITVAFAVSANAQVGIGTAFIEQTLDYTYLDEELDSEFAAGLSTIVPDDEDIGEIGTFGLSEDCFTVPDQPDR